MSSMCIQRWDNLAQVVSTLSVFVNCVKQNTGAPARQCLTYGHTANSRQSWSRAHASAMAGSPACLVWISVTLTRTGAPEDDPCVMVLNVYKKGRSRPTQ